MEGFTSVLASLWATLLAPGLVALFSWWLNQKSKKQAGKKGGWQPPFFCSPGYPMKNLLLFGT